MPKPLEKRWVLDELRSLKGKGWVDFSLVSGGSAGTVSLTDEGFRIAKDLTECEREARPCPASLDELAEIEPTLTGIVKRDSVLDQIRATLNFKTNHMIVLFGQPMVGKSKLLERVFKELANEGSLPLEC